MTHASAPRKQVQRRIWAATALACALVASLPATPVQADQPGPVPATALVSGSGGAAARAVSATQGSPLTIPIPASAVQLQAAVATDLSPAGQAAAAAVTPAIVDILATAGSADAWAAGTGIVIGPDGLVLTSRHVVAGATGITATTVATGAQYPATVLGYSPGEDIAVLQLGGASGLQPASIGRSAGIPVGTPVVAVGNAGGTGGQPTAIPGEVLGRNRTIEVTDPGDGTLRRLRHLIAVSAGMQQGQSGGPLVDLAGAVVGVNAANSVDSDGVSRAGWAVPIHRALAVVAAVRAGTEVNGVHIGPPGYLGVFLASAQGHGGAAVRSVVPDSAAALVGLQAGDRITRVAGKRIRNGQALAREISSRHAGEQIRVSWRTAAGHTRSAIVTLGSGPQA